MAKSFLTMGRSRGFAVGSEQGLREWSEVYDAKRTAPDLRRALPGRGKEEIKRKKKLRKLRKKAQRRNRG